MPLKTQPDLKPNLAAFLVPFGRIVPNPHNPRRHFDTGKLQELADNIGYLRTQGRGIGGSGVLQALGGTVEAGAVLADGSLKPGAMIMINKGERRWRACGLAGFQPFDVVPMDLSEVGGAENALEEAFFENEHRTDMQPLEIAHFLFAKKNAYQPPLTIRDLAARVSKKRSYVEMYLNLLKLTPEMLEILETRPDAASSLARVITVRDPKFQRQLVEDVRQGVAYKVIVAKIAGRKDTDEAHARSDSRVPDEGAADTALTIVPKYDPVAELEAMTRRARDLEHLLLPVIARLPAAQRTRLRARRAELQEALESLDLLLMPGSGR